MSWYYKMGGSLQGPIEREKLVEMLRAGILTPQVEVSEDQTSWLIAPQVPGLMAEVVGQPQTSPAQTPAPQPAPPKAVPSPPPPAQNTALPTQAPTPPPAQQPNTAINQVPAPPAQATAPTAAALPSPPSQIPNPPSQSPAPAPAPVIDSPSATPTSPEPNVPAAKMEIPSLPIPVMQESKPPEEAPVSAPADQPSLDLPTKDVEEVSEPTETPAPDAEPAQATGPVAHIVLDPAARAKKKKKRQSSGVAKLVVCGLLGVAALAVAGYFTATKVFGMDFRPAKIDTSVSKFMIESPELVASIDPNTILKSKAYRKALISQPQLANHPFMAYVKDVENVTVALDKVVSPKSYIAIVDLKRDYRTEFVANLFSGGTSETIGSFEMHTTINDDGSSTSVALPQPRTLLIGSSYSVKTLLERNGHPKLYPRESELIASAHENNKGIKARMHFDSVKSAVARLRRETKEKIEGQDAGDNQAVADLIGTIEKAFKNLDYAANNIKHATFEVEFADDLIISAIAECGSESKATKIVSIYSDLTNSFPVAGQTPAADAKPFTEGTKVVAKTNVDPSEIGGAIGLAVLEQGFE